MRGSNSFSLSCEFSYECVKCTKETKSTRAKKPMGSTFAWPCQIHQNYVKVLPSHFYFTWSCEIGDPNAKKKKN